MLHNHSEQAEHAAVLIKYAQLADGWIGHSLHGLALATRQAEEIARLRAQLEVCQGRLARRSSDGDLLHAVLPT